MSYSSAEFREFHAQASLSLEGLHINLLLLWFCSKDVGTTINLLITNRILTEDELLGIEHFIGEASFEKLKLKKHEHVDLVLSPQMRMREKD